MAGPVGSVRWRLQKIFRPLLERLETLSAYRHHFAMNAEGGNSVGAAGVGGSRNPVGHGHAILSVAVRRTMCCRAFVIPAWTIRSAPTPLHITWCWRRRKWSGRWGDRLDARAAGGDGGRVGRAYQVVGARAAAGGRCGTGVACVYEMGSSNGGCGMGRAFGGFIR